MSQRKRGRPLNLADSRAVMQSPPEVPSLSTTSEDSRRSDEVAGEEYGHPQLYHDAVVERGAGRQRWAGMQLGVQYASH